MKSSVEDIKLIKVFNNFSNKGNLVAIESIQDIPFNILRVFSVLGDLGAIRGNHAHIKCRQFLICLHGKIEVLCHDGDNEKFFLLENSTQGILIPEGIWCSQRYLYSSSLLLVLCDRYYEPEDYIYDFVKFNEFKKKNRRC